MVNKWYGLFSHTGKELEALSRSDEVPFKLEAAFTNNMAYDGNITSLVYKLNTFEAVNHRLVNPFVVHYDSLITLHGYMGILPAEVLADLRKRGCKVYNIHPAPIHLYPELRGKDPQERMYTGIQNREYNYIGVVIHEVDAGVDTGKIVHWVLQLADPSMTKEELYQQLHDLGTQAWESFFRERMYENGEST